MRAFRGSVLAALIALLLVSPIGCGSSTTSSSSTPTNLGPADQEALQREAMKSLKKTGKGMAKAQPIGK
ncbi:hypothetical protein [Singulisphaera sp. PoT]|uniref:hypothetical protein n=1 Tax=Singulisphaera sp. PoT TaxID=3411797 RepID=UPI003BF48533